MEQIAPKMRELIYAQIWTQDNPIDVSGSIARLITGKAIEKDKSLHVLDEAFMGNTVAMEADAALYRADRGTKFLFAHARSQASSILCADPSQAYLTSRHISTCGVSRWNSLSILTTSGNIKLSI